MDAIVREIIVQLIGFTLFFWVLAKFAWKPVLSLLDARKERIAKGFDDIEKKTAELDKLREEYEAHMAKIEDESRLKIQEAISEGKKIAQEVREQAREESNQILVKAKENIELETSKARIQLKEELTNLVLLTTERVLKAKMDDTQQKGLVSQFLDELSGDPAK